MVTQLQPHQVERTAQPDEIEKGERARAWLDGWADRWKVEDAETLLVDLGDKVHELHELVGKKRAEDADARLDAVEELLGALREYVGVGRGVS